MMTLFELEDHTPSKDQMKESVKTKREIAERITLFARNVQWPANFHVCKTKDDLIPISRAIKKAKRMVFDVETSGTDPWVDRVYGLGIHADGHSYAIPIEHITLPCLKPDDVADVLGWAFPDPSVKRLNHNIKFDGHLVERTFGVGMGEFYCDTELQARVINPDTEFAPHGLKELCDQYGLDPEGVSKGNYVKQFGKTAWSYIEAKCATYYLCKDTMLVEKLKIAQDAVLAQKPKLFRLFWDWEMPVLNIAYQEMESVGMRVDPEYIRTTLTPTVYTAYAKATEAMRPLIEPHLKYAQAETVEKVLRSPDKLRKVFFDKLNCPLKKHYTLKRDKSGQFTKRSLDKEAISGLADTFEPLRLLKEWRGPDTLKKMFVDTLPERIIDERIHPTVNTCGTSTGRFSMQRPNLQQVPSRMGPLVRNMFIPDPGNVFMSADFSQQEMRIMAHFAPNGALERIFTHSKYDMYSQMSIDLFEIPEEEFADPVKAKNHPSRRDAKAIVLAMGYKMGVAKFARSAKKAYDAAKGLFDRYFEAYPEIKQYQSRAIAFAKRNGFIVTLLGRERPLYHINNTQEGGLRASAEREAVNTPIQGTAADQVKKALVLVYRLIKKNNWPVRIVLQIHDEILYEMPIAWAKENPDAIAAIIHTMETALPLTVPMKSSATFEPRWGTEMEIDDIEAAILDDVAA